MFAYIVRRLLSTILVMAVVALFVFSLLHLTPGDPAAIIAGDIATDEDILRIRAGARPRPAASWCSSAAGCGACCTAISALRSSPICRSRQLIAQRIEPTVALTLCTLLVSVLVAVPLGVLAACEGRHLDRPRGDVFSVLGFSVPVFVLAYVLILLFPIQLDWLPVQGYRQHRDGLWPWLRT